MNNFSPTQSIDCLMEQDRRAFLMTMSDYLSSDTVSLEDKQHELTATMNALRQIGIFAGLTDV